MRARGFLLLAAFLTACSGQSSKRETVLTFSGSALGAEPSHTDAELVEWDDWAIGPTDREHPVTRGLHVGFRAPSREAVDAFWQAGIDAGYRDDGAPGPRTVYGPDYWKMVNVIKWYYYLNDNRSNRAVASNRTPVD